MHSDISHFSGLAFYGGQLQTVPRPHQREETAPPDFRHHATPWETLLARHRLLFIPSRRDPSHAGQQNEHEARVITRLLSTYCTLCRANGLEIVGESAGPRQLSIGIITPYRAQIALLRQEIQRLREPLLEAITVDTVERFQGSQRDIIIYSCCVSDERQLAFLSREIEEDGLLIDRKLNVALTRARKQLIVTGVPDLLAPSSSYHRLMEYTRERGAYIDSDIERFLDGTFRLAGEPTGDEHTVAPDPRFPALLRELVTLPIEQDPRSALPGKIHGHDTGFIHLNILHRGRAGYRPGDTPFGTTADERVRMYCHLLARRRYLASLSLFTLHGERLAAAGPVTLLDIGCGPATAALAFRRVHPAVRLHYAGVDPSPAMLRQARTFLDSPLFRGDATYTLNEKPEKLPDDLFATPGTVIIHLSHLPGSLDGETATHLAALARRHPSNAYHLLLQDTPLAARAPSLAILRALLPLPPGTPRVARFLDPDDPTRAHAYLHELLSW
jgi:SAM-dependent methyltransferase